MKIKLLAILCVLAILAGTLGVTVTAEPQSDTFKAGYALVDLNPYWSIYAGERKPATMQDGDIMPLPMAGYGDNAHRLSDATLYDDNGDGEVSGPNGDGLHATVLAIQSGDKITLFITVDLISVKMALTKQIRTAITEATGIPDTLITVAGTHTHNGVDMTVTFNESGEPFTSADGNTDYTAVECNAYLACYKAYLISQLAEGARAAVGDLTDATMEKGTIDMLTYNDNRIMNNVRHYKQVFQDWESWRKQRTVTYVRGSSFNNDVDDNDSYDSYYNYAKSSYWGTGSFAEKNGEAESVSNSDHNMHVLQFKFANGKEPIAFVNWRGHPANANKKANGQDVFQKLGGDYISSTRYALESYGYRAAFVLGAAGNLGINTSVPSKTWLSSAASAANKATTVLYGEILAAAANDLMTNNNKNDAIITEMHQIEAGPILASRLKYQYELNVPSTLEYNAAVAAKAAYAAGTHKSEFSYVYTDSTTKEKFVIASSYHANSAVSRGDYTAGQKSTMELNVITVGKELAFLALPYEASDRYSTEATLDTANNFNDWDKLANVLNFGTPFVITCANDHKGYVPNNLAYTYNTDALPKYKYAIGSYESQTTYAAQGEGEKIIDTLKTMMEQMEAKTEYCAYCEDTFTWTPLTAATLSSNSHCLPGGHYYLRDDLEYTASQVSLKDGNQVCLDLNGKTYSVAHAKNASRAVNMSGSSILNIQDSSDEQTGVVMGRGVLKQSIIDSTYTGFSNATLNIGKGCTVNFYGGTLTQDNTEGYGVTSGGVVQVAGTLNMFGGTITGGVVSNYTDRSTSNGSGGNVNVSGTFNMYDGIIKDGSATNKGNNLYIATGGSFAMYGGKIIGDVGNTVRSVYSYGSVTLSGGAVVNEIAFNAVPASNLCVEGTYTGTVNIVMPTPDGGFATGLDVGNAYNNANISDATISITGCTLPMRVSGGNLVLAREGAPTTVDADGNVTYYDAVTEALEAYAQENSTAVKLMLNEDVQALDITGASRDVALDLNGHKLTAINVSGTKTVYISDAATDDYTVEDGVYGTVPATANVQPADGYMKIVEGKTASFHKVERRLNSVNLRCTNTGIYYGCRFAGDEKVAGQVEEYGVALQIGSAPTAESIAADKYHSTHAGSLGTTWKPGTEGNGGYGVLLKDIMKKTNGKAFNNRNANYVIYGVAYMKLIDGSIVISEDVQFTLREVVELTDEKFDSFNADQQSSVAKMYEDYEQVMVDWEVPNIRAYVEGKES